MLWSLYLPRARHSSGMEPRRSVAYAAVMTTTRRDELREALRGAGLRATPSRVAVLRLLREAGQPLSHAEVIERLGEGEWDRATLYRNLADLTEAGLARRADLGDHVWRFEITSADHGGATHPHFVCTSCGEVECLPEVKLDVRRGKAPRTLRTKKVEVQIRGLCDTCD